MQESEWCSRETSASEVHVLTMAQRLYARIHTDLSTETDRQRHYHHQHMKAY